MVKKREWTEGSYLHITIRGNRRSDIFRDEGDFGFFRELVIDRLEYFKEDNLEVANYCFMTNHVHFLIKTNDKPVSVFMGSLISKYTLYFNKKYNYIGRLFQGRFFSEVINGDKHLLETSRYIDLNPYKAKMVTDPGEYFWSGYNHLIGEREEKLISENLILDYFKKSERYKFYREFVELKIKEEIVSNGINS